jgi:hypothetical protein
VGGDRYGRDGVGLINLPTLERELAEGAAKQLGELVGTRTFPHVSTPTKGLIWRSSAWGANQIEILPVMARADVHKSLFANVRTRCSTTRVAIAVRLNTTLSAGSPRCRAGDVNLARLFA